MLDIPEYTPITTTTMTTMTEHEEAQYRFGGERYQIQGGSTTGPGWIVKKAPGAYTYPSEDTKKI